RGKRGNGDDGRRKKGEENEMNRKLSPKKTREKEKRAKPTSIHKIQPRHSLRHTVRIASHEVHDLAHVRACFRVVRFVVFAFLVLALLPFLIFLLIIPIFPRTFLPILLLILLALLI